MDYEREAFEAHLLERNPRLAMALELTPEGEYRVLDVRNRYSTWVAAREDFQKRVEELAQQKDLDRAVKFKAGCDCGCNTPSFTEPFEALRFLMHRMNHAGIGDAVGQSYAHDIATILKHYGAMESNAHLLVINK